MKKLHDLPLAGILMTLGIFLVVFINFRLSQPPKVVPAYASDSLFSAERAALHFPYIASKPHPIGSRAHDEVRDYIMDQIEYMGYMPELHVSEFYGSQRAAMLENILVRIPGTGGGGRKSILFMGHYDTVFPAPGASDDGSAVVTLLEVLRMLGQYPAMKNDLIFLLTDGEEYGLLGARAFVEKDSWSKDMDLVVNLEAMGTKGMSSLFETGYKNLKIVREFVKCVPFPVGNSLSVEVYHYMPNATDFEVFMIQDFQGLNFAYVGNTYDYHTGGDNIENTDLRSIQHHGSHAAALALHFGNSDLDLDADQNAVYFNTIGKHIVYYPFGWVPAITAVVLLLAAGLVIAGIFLKKIKIPGLIFSLVSYLILLLLLYVLSRSLLQIISSQYPGYAFGLVAYRQQGIVLSIALMATAFSIVYFRFIIRGVQIWQPLALLAWIILLQWWSGEITAVRIAIAVAISSWLFLVHRRPLKPMDLSAGALVVWILLMTFAAVKVPGASYVFTWPLVFSLVPMAYMAFRRRGEENGLFAGLLLLVFAIPLLAWFPLLMNTFQLAMGIRMVGIVMLVAGLVMGLLVPHALLATKRVPWLIPTVLMATGLFLLLAHTVKLKYNERYKKQNSITYIHDESGNESYWYANDIFPDEWTSQFFTGRPDTLAIGRVFPIFEGRVLRSQAVGDNLKPANLQVLADSVIDGERMLELLVVPETHSSEWQFYFGGAEGGMELQVSDMARSPLERYADNDWYRFLYLAPPDEGVRLTLFCQPEQAVNLQLNEIDYETLPYPANYHERSANMMNGGDSRIIISRHKL